MSQLAVGWIAEDPARFLRLTLRRAWLSFFPSRDIVGWFPVIGAGGAAFVLAVIGFLKALACVSSFLLKKNILQIMVFSVLPLCPYWITHIYLRYDLLTCFTTVVAIVVAADGLWRHRPARRALSGPDTSSGHL